MRSKDDRHDPGHTVAIEATADALARSAAPSPPEMPRGACEAAGDAFDPLELDPLDAQLAELRRNLEIAAAGRRSAEREAVALRAAVTAAQRRADNASRSLPFRLGKAIVEAKRPLDFLRLPGTLRRIAREFGAEWVDDFTADAAGAATGRRAVSEQLRALAAEQGAAAAEAWARAEAATSTELAWRLIELARHLSDADPVRAAGLGREAVAADPTDHRLKWLAFALFATGKIAEPRQLLDAVRSKGVPLSSDEARMAAMIFALDRPEPAPRSPAPAAANPAAPSRTCAIIASRSLPLDSDDASQALHRLAQRLRAAGWSVAVVTPPGYPDPEHSALLVEMVDGIEYRRLRALPHPAWFHDDPLEPLAAAVTGAIRSTGANLVMLSDDIVPARTGAMAAARLGLPYALYLAGAALAEDCLAEPGSQTELVRGRLRATLELAASAALTVAPRRDLVEILAMTGVARDKIVCLSETTVTEDAPSAAGSPAPSDPLLDRLDRVAVG